MKKKLIAAGAMAALMAVSGQMMDLNQSYVGISRAEAGLGGLGGAAKAVAGNPAENYKSAITNLAKATAYMLIAQQQMENINGEKLTDMSAATALGNEIVGGNLTAASDAIKNCGEKKDALIDLVKKADLNNADVQENIQYIADLRAKSKAANKAALGDVAKLIASGGGDGVAALIASGKEIKALLDMQNEVHKAMKPLDDFEKSNKKKGDPKKVADLQLEDPSTAAAAAEEDGEE